MNRFFLGAYWAARQESIDQCGDRLLKFFAELTSCGPSLARWFKLGRSRKQALQHQMDVTNRAALWKLLDDGRHWTDFDKRIMDDLGFSIALWNGTIENKAAQLRLTCGAYADDMRFPNHVIIELPHTLGDLSNSMRMREVLVASAKTWDPAWAGIMSHDALEKRRFRVDEPFVDWMLYISRQWLPSVPEMTPPASAESVDSGTLIIVQPEMPDPSNDVHVQNIHCVESVLRSVWLVPNDR